MGLFSPHDKRESSCRKIAAGSSRETESGTTFYLGKWLEKSDLL
jgi:hypothetical protein